MLLNKLVIILLDTLLLCAQHTHTQIHITRTLNCLKTGHGCCNKTTYRTHNTCNRITRCGCSAIKNRSMRAPAFSPCYSVTPSRGVGTLSGAHRSSSQDRLQLKRHNMHHAAAAQALLLQVQKHQIRHAVVCMHHVSALEDLYMTNQHQVIKLWTQAIEPNNT